MVSSNFLIFSYSDKGPYQICLPSILSALISVKKLSNNSTLSTIALTDPIALVFKDFITYKLDLLFLVSSIKTYTNSPIAGLGILAISSYKFTLYLAFNGVFLTVVLKGPAESIVLP